MYTIESAGWNKRLEGGPKQLTSAIAVWIVCDVDVGIVN